MNYLIYGTSYHLVDIEISKIIKEREYKSLSLCDITIQEVLEDASYSSMFMEEKIIVVKNFETLFESKKDNSSGIDSLINYLKNPDKMTTIIFVSNSKLNERSKQNKELLGYLKVISTPIISKSYELANLLGDIIKKDGYGISQNALNIFATKCATNVDIAIMEFEKLKSIKGNNRLISEKDIEQFVSNYNTNDIFDLKDAVINKRIDASVKMLDDLETSKMEIVPIVIMLAKEYETLYAIKALSEKRLTNDQIGAELDNMHPYRVKLLREASSKYSLKELEQDLLYLCNLNMKMVSEDNLGYDELRKFLLML